MEIIRKPVVAGQFYPAEADTLEYMIDEYFKISIPCECKSRAKAVIVPHAGYIYSGIVAASAYNCFRKLDKETKWKVLLMGPSHYELFKGAAIPESTIWETPLGNVSVKKLKENKLITENEDAFKMEHSLEVQLPFLQKILSNFEVYPLCLSNIDSKKLADDLFDFAKQDDVLIVASSDLSHYHPYDEAKALDDITGEIIMNLDVENADKIDACGDNSIITLLHLAKKLNLKTHKVDYKNSGDTEGERMSVVGYGAYSFII